MMPPASHSAPDPGPEPIGAMLARMRLARGLSQPRLAELLCATAGVPTVTRHEVSRWERQERIPGAFWLGWLSLVLGVPRDRLEAAAASAHRRATVPGAPDPHLLWRPPRPGELLTALDGAGDGDLGTLAHIWLTGTALSGSASRVHPRPAGGHRGRPDGSGLGELRRMDDLVGGADLAARVDRRLRTAITALPTAGGGRTLRLVAQWAQLAGWVHADAGDGTRARGAYRVGLRAAVTAGDHPLAVHVLGCASYLHLWAGDARRALLLARTASAGAGGRTPATVRALALQRVALASALAGERGAAQAALAASERAVERARPGREPAWLYWLDEAELAAMTGRCLVVLGRPVRAVPLLAGHRRRAGPRTAALYGGWLARAYCDLGEVERACELAADAWTDAVRAGSVRVAAVLRRVDAVLLRHRDVPAVREYERLARAATRYLPSP